MCGGGGGRGAGGGGEGGGEGGQDRTELGKRKVSRSVSQSASSLPGMAEQDEDKDPFISPSFAMAVVPVVIQYEINASDSPGPCAVIPRPGPGPCAVKPRPGPGPCAIKGIRLALRWRVCSTSLRRIGLGRCQMSLVRALVTTKGTHASKTVSRRGGGGC